MSLGEGGRLMPDGWRGLSVSFMHPLLLILVRVTGGVGVGGTPKRKHCIERFNTDTSIVAPLIYLP